MKDSLGSMSSRFLGEDGSPELGRRKFGQITLGATALLTSASRSSGTTHPNPPGIKIATTYKIDPTDEELQFIGLCLCCGTWLEGGKQLTGKDPAEMIHYFGAQKKIFKIHFRNVSAPLPHFIETFMDNGYYDMYKIMKALREVNFDGIVIPDHIPGLGRMGTAQGSASAGPSAPRPSGNVNQAGIAYSIAYMRALRDRANREAES